MALLRPSRGFTPYVTGAIVIICLVIPTLALNAWVPATQAITQPLEFTPVLALVQPWRLVSAGFVHAGLLHLVFNMIALWVAGKQLEEILGHARFAATWLVSTTGAYVFAMVVAVFTPISASFGVTIGASGGVFALFALILVLQRGAGGEVTGLAVLLALSLGYSFFAAGVSWEVHLGGILVGAALGWALVTIARRVRPRPVSVAPGLEAVESPAETRARRQRWQLIVLAVAALVEIGVWWATSAAVIP